MAKDTKKKKANPLLEDEEMEETETDTDVEETDEEVEEKPAKPTSKKGAKAGAKSAEASEDDEVDEEDEDSAKSLIQKDKVKSRPLNNIEAEIRKDIETIKSSLEKQPKVRMFLPLGIGEKKGSKGAYESVTINGYRMVLPKGEYVTVPQAVADILEAHYNMTPENTEAGAAFRLDRPREKDGMSTDEALG